MLFRSHAVRSATAMFKRLVRQAIAGGLRAEAIALATDDALIHELLQADVHGLARRLRERQLAKRALDLPATDLPATTPSWPGTDPDLVERVEDRLAAELGVQPGGLYLDFPAKDGMLDVDVPLVKRNGTVERLTGLPRVAAELYRAARRLRVFVLESVALEPKRIVELVMLPREEVARRVETGRALLSRG